MNDQPESEKQKKERVLFSSIPGAEQEKDQHKIVQKFQSRGFPKEQTKRVELIGSEALDGFQAGAVVLLKIGLAPTRKQRGLQDPKKCKNKAYNKRLANDRQHNTAIISVFQ